MYLLDTCAISDFVKGHPRTLLKIRSISPDDLCLSTISYMEIQYGLKNNPQKAPFIENILDDFFSCIHVLEFTMKDAYCAGQIRADLKKKRTPIGPYDLLIAATAIHNNLVVITSNTNEFQRVSGLVCEDWR